MRPDTSAPVADPASSAQEETAAEAATIQNGEPEPDSGEIAAESTPESESEAASDSASEPAPDAQDAPAADAPAAEDAPEDAAEDAPEAPPPPAEDVPEEPSPAVVVDGEPPRRRLVPALLVGFGVLTVAVVTLVVILGLQVRGNAADGQLRAEALQVARQQSINLITVDPETVDRQMRTLLDGSTGQFREQSEQVRDQFGQVVRGGNVRSIGRVDEAGVISLSETRAEVLLALSSTVHNAQTPDGSRRIYRLKVTLLREEDRWLVSDMRFVS